MILTVNEESRQWNVSEVTRHAQVEQELSPNQGTKTWALTILASA